MKNYISIARKKEIANDVLMMCLEQNNKIDNFKKKIYTFAFAAMEYTDVKIGDNFEDIMSKYDELNQNGEAFKIKNMEDYKELCEIVDCVTMDTEKSNSFEQSFSKLSNEIVDFLERIGGVLEDKINEFDVDILKDTDIQDFMSIIEKLK